MSTEQKSMWPDKDVYVTPEYLLSHGFVQYNSYNQGDVHEIPFTEGELHFREAEFDRNMFVVTFGRHNGDDDGEYSHSIYVQDDAGCGFTYIPERWWNLSIDHFEAIYYGIRGNKPKETKTLISKS